MLLPTKANYRRSERKVCGSPQQITVRLRIVCAAVQIQENDVRDVAVELAKGSAGIGDLSNAIASSAQNFFKDVAESFVRINQEKTLKT